MKIRKVDKILGYILISIAILLFNNCKFNQSDYKNYAVIDSVSYINGFNIYLIEYDFSSGFPVPIPAGSPIYHIAIAKNSGQIDTSNWMMVANTSCRIHKSSKNNLIISAPDTADFTYVNRSKHNIKIKLIQSGALYSIDKNRFITQFPDAVLESLIYSVKDKQLLVIECMPYLNSSIFYGYNISTIGACLGKPDYKTDNTIVYVFDIAYDLSTKESIKEFIIYYDENEFVIDTEWN